ncbi:MAG: hypothetical protein M3N47_04495 [Chloroflexota bacterium]|nr:hypothetical protein [Chloroflexota bacterium]
MEMSSRVRSNAHLVLAGIRFVNGMLALFAPCSLAQRLDVDADKSPALLYLQHMFGIRTILITLDLVTGSEADRRRALQRSPVIHACDATAAALAGAHGNLAPRPARLTVAISLVNLLLALIARPHPARQGRQGAFRSGSGSPDAGSVFPNTTGQRDLVVRVRPTGATPSTSSPSATARTRCPARAAGAAGPAGGAG